MHTTHSNSRYVTISHAKFYNKSDFIFQSCTTLPLPLLLKVLIHHQNQFFLRNEQLPRDYPPTQRQKASTFLLISIFS